jgi:hypothetical protein
LTFQSGTGSVGAANGGFWGIALQAGASYNLSFYACSSNSFSGPLTVLLQSTNGTTIYAQTNFTGLTSAWQRLGATLVSSSTDPYAELVLQISQPATVWLNVVSLFPQATLIIERTDFAPTWPPCFRHSARRSCAILEATS